MTYKFYLEDGMIKAKIGNSEAVELTLTNQDLFIYQGVVLKFSRNNEAVTGLVVDAGRVKDLKFSKKQG